MRRFCGNRIQAGFEEGQGFGARFDRGGEERQDLEESSQRDH